MIAPLTSLRTHEYIATAKQREVAMISFENAIEVAKTNAKILIENSKNIVLEGVLISDDKKLYEVSLSYDLQGTDAFETKQSDDSSVNNSLSQLTKILG